MVNLRRVFLIWRREVEGQDCVVSWGLGDLIRGTMTTYELCKRLGIELIVDISFHPIQLYVKNAYTPYSLYVKKNISNIIPIHANIDLERVLRDEINEEIIIQTNSDPRILKNHFEGNFQFDQECKNFIIDLLEPSMELFGEILWYKSTLPKSYNIIHIRLRDEDILGKSIEDYGSLLFKIREVYLPNDVIVTNSNNLRKFIKENGKNLVVLDVGETGHIEIEEDVEGVKNTLIEFYLMSDSNLILSYSSYWWISNFIKWISICKNIEVINLNPKCTLY